MLKTKPAVRFSLAALMLSITFAAIGLGIWRRFHEFKTVHRTLTNQAEHIRPDPGPATFHNFLSGRIYRVDHLSFRAKHTFGDDEMAALLPLKKLRQLSLQSTKVSDDVAETLTQFTNLRVLSVAGTQVGDAFVNKISELEQLEELFLSQTKITDEGMASIAKLENLRVLTLSETAVSNVGLRDVAKLTKLESLSLQLRKMPTHWLAELEPLTNLRSLKLSDLDDSGVQELAKLERLESLQVWDLGYVGHLSTLGSLSSLKELTIRTSAIKPGERFPTMLQLETLLVKSEIGFSIEDQPNLRLLDFRMRRLSQDMFVSNSPLLEDLRIEQESSSGTQVDTVVRIAKLPQLKQLKVICCSLTVSGAMNDLEALDLYDKGPRGSFQPPGEFTLTIEDKLPSLGLVPVPKGYRKDEKTEAILQERRRRR